MKVKAHVRNGRQHVLSGAEAHLMSTRLSGEIATLLVRVRHILFAHLLIEERLRGRKLVFTLMTMSKL